MKICIILIITALFILFLYLRNTRIKYDEEKHILDIKKQKGVDFYTRHKSKRFFNSWKKDERKFYHKIKWFFEKSEKYSYNKNSYLPKNAIINLDTYKQIFEENKNFIIWIGHNTSLLKIENNYFLVDPVFSERIFFTKRKTKIGLSIEEINSLLKNEKLHILITHNHYDHLDISSLKNLDINGNIYIPKNMSKLLEGIKCNSIVELDWWKTLRINNLSLTFLPAQHYSHRLNQSKNLSLWGSYNIKNNISNKSIFIGGDSGYFGAYKEFGKMFNIKYAVLPIGGYDLRWYTAYEHMNIEDSLKAIEDLRCDHVIPTHWGAFHLGMEPVDYTGFRFSEIIENDIKMENKIKILNLGEIYSLI